jgi:hypothetical protein
LQGYFLLNPVVDSKVFDPAYSFTYFTAPMMTVLGGSGGSGDVFRYSPLGDKYLASIGGADSTFGGIRRVTACDPGDTSYPCIRDDGFYNELTNPRVADYVLSLATAFFDAHIHPDEQNRRRVARSYLKSQQVMEASGQQVNYQYK